MKNKLIPPDKVIEIVANWIATENKLDSIPNCILQRNGYVKIIDFEDVVISAEDLANIKTSVNFVYMHASASDETINDILSVIGDKHKDVVTSIINELCFQCISLKTAKAKLSELFSKIVNKDIALL